MPLKSDFFKKETVRVAHDLLGKELLYQGCGGLIIETEAYHESEQACHGYGGRKSKRNEVMFQKAGTLYVYRIHQVFCLNIVTEAKGICSAVLIRALSPTHRVDSMKSRRPKKPHDLCSGPGKLCQSLDINLDLNGQFIETFEGFEIHDPGPLKGKISTHPRVGISKATDLPWRFCLDLTSK